MTWQKNCSPYSNAVTLQGHFTFGILQNYKILVTELPLKFTYEHVCKTHFEKAGLFEAEYAKSNILT